MGGHKIDGRRVPKSEFDALVNCNHEKITGARSELLPTCAFCGDYEHNIINARLQTRLTRALHMAKLWKQLAKVLFERSDFWEYQCRKHGKGWNRAEKYAALWKRYAKKWRRAFVIRYGSSQVNIIERMEQTEAELAKVKDENERLKVELRGMCKLVNKCDELIEWLCNETHMSYEAHNKAVLHSELLVELNDKASAILKRL